MVNITLGADPEVFIEQNGVVVSGIDLIPGDKNNPHPITDKGHAIQVDNVAWEYNIPPSTTEDEFVENISLVRDYLSKEAAKHDCVLSRFSSFELAAKELKHPTAKRFGCEPDYNVYTRDHNPPINQRTRLRVVGGHVHFGYPNPDAETTDIIVQLFDVFLTMPAMLRDSDTRRRELYGKPGSFRFKDFGVECRALSNFWIHDEANIRWVYERSVMLATMAIEQKELALELIAKFSTLVVEIVTDNKFSQVEGTIETIQQHINNYKK